jgi:hypothetical protein
MTQVVDILRDALGHLKVQDANSAVKPIDARDGIRALNLMMREWEVDGPNLGWSDVSDPTDTLPVPPEAEAAIGYNLAVRLRPKYGVAIEADIIALARDCLATLTAQQTVNTYARTEYPDLPAGTGRPGGSWRDGYYR